ncbi:restriction endonuclease subunit S [Arthrobacter silviterrae]|uniref:Restriction endonuclease subunit S n=2 Tax=Arthrobacter silviterrae TaxID=2026658 RepID=A0ABX0D5J9_9MICC|nr:restriction endonuclease subunit S [Arthrobacter silviterrae]NGN82162.1 restriction endonuclease subunit S [Arthrobacter silviterrae]
MPEPTKRNDVVLTSEAPLGRAALVPTDDPLVLAQRVFGLRGKPGILDSRFLYYAFQTAAVKADLQGRATGTTVLGIRQPSLKKVQIPAPCYAEQQAIAEVLGALDDKIAANTRIAATAELLAASLYQRALKEAEWSNLTFADLAQVSGGGTPSTKTPEYWDGDIPWATPTDLTALQGPYLEATSRTISADGLSACASPLYPKGSILMTSRATIGAFAIAQLPTAVNQGFIVVQPNDPALDYWIFHEMRSRVDEFISLANGATFLELSRGNFKKFKVRLAADSVITGFTEQARPLHDSARMALLENTKLAATRDALLPQLMSGKLRVKDLESIVSAAI